MTDNPVIDPNCEFGSALTDAEIKSIFSTIPQLTRDNGFGCDSEGAAGIDNMQLGSWLTALLAQPTRALSSLHDNGDFARCIWENFLCGFVQELFFVQVVQTGGVITLPPDGEYTVYGSWGASSSPAYRPINADGFVGSEHDEDADIYTGVICQENVPGGTIYNINSINSQVSDPVSDYWVKVFAIRTDWPSN